MGVKNQSYYTGGGIKQVKNRRCANCFKKLRKNISGKSSNEENTDSEVKKKKIL